VHERAVAAIADDGVVAGTADEENLVTIADDQIGKDRAVDALDPVEDVVGVVAQVVRLADRQIDGHPAAVAVIVDDVETIAAEDRVCASAAGDEVIAIATLEMV